jgi:proteasome accessory factor B
MDLILEWLLNKEYPNCSRMMREFGVDRKTAWRDIEFMKDRKKLPIDYDDERHGYFLSGPVPKVAAVSVTEREMFELYVMHQAIEHYRGTPLEQRLERFFRRMAGQLDNEEQFTMEDLGGVLSFRPSAPDEADAKLFELVTRAVRERRWLRFDYRKPGEREVERRRVQPYHVLEYGGRWYLLAYDPMRQDVRTFVLGRMREAVMLDERFERPKDFDPRKHLEKGIGVMGGTGDFQVVIQMDAWLTDILRGRRWHPSQVVEELPGGGSQLRLRLGCLEEIEQYVLSWGAHATVIGPQALRERVGKVARELAARYADVMRDA